MSKRITRKRALELYEKAQNANKPTPIKVGKHIEQQGKVKAFLQNLKERYLSTNRPDLVDELNKKEVKVVPPEL